MQLGLVTKASYRECKVQLIWFETWSNDITISSYIASHYHASTPPGEQGEADHCCDQKPRHLLLVLLSPLLLALQHLSLCDNLNNFSLTPISTASCYLGHCWNLFWNCIKAFLGCYPWSLWRRIWTLLTSFSPFTFSLAVLEMGFADVAEVSACDRFSWRLGRANALFSLRMITMFITTIPTFGKMWMKTSQTIV